MNKQQAHIVLNQVRDGVLHPESVVIAALCLTGDIYAKCSNVDNSVDNWTGDRLTSLDSHNLLPDMER